MNLVKRVYIKLQTIRFITFSAKKLNAFLQTHFKKFNINANINFTSARAQPLTSKNQYLHFVEFRFDSCFKTSRATIGSGQ